MISSSASSKSTASLAPNLQHLSSKQLKLVQVGLCIILLLAQITSVHSWAPSTRLIGIQPYTADRHQVQSHVAPSTSPRTFKTALNVFETKDKTAATAATTTTNEESPTSSKQTSSLEETTESYGLEAGLFQSLKQNDGGQSAKDLLAKYGVAYLATSIPLAIISFALCYFLVDSGVDVASLLSNVGIEVNESGEKVGTFALAYAAHKAASPIRFPPTVLLTPIVAKMIGKEPEVERD
mmetsp:Transcript_20413/g.30670  ORF Transcript_20413/g.30670 Transcript_20413/m.30670 type:complete len:238 (+) Transcript_20413:133-846(+)|eukprot:CAMPEP_0203633112 /NCGR_PEP_ID=MMETSP0088-20131115/266_1 /ASSEMBLY_ACC=CAM_ASM_001087 /TAXON_ID=426623 /ORGANISM="Chaetoceros affinis, Strain CCMP159" /LENGTH=237 /DNA_ID=CAMNT_0050486335 /DNA_START=52 /DNA_END=765 /DNA_ORIENTATION=+